LENKLNTFMSFSLTVDSLSALTRVVLSYKYNTNEPLNYVPIEYSNRISYNKYSAFDNIQDASFSKKTALFLTDVKSLSNVFAQTQKDYTIGEIPGSFFIKLSSDYAVLYSDNLIYLSSKKPSATTKLVISVSPLSGNLVELNTNQNTKLIVDPIYPYTINATSLTLPIDQQYRQQFLIEYINGYVSFKTKTAEGYRYLAFGSDGILRGIGLILNDTIFNSYRFATELITSNYKLSLGFDPTSKEVKYYNDLESFINRLTLEVKDARQSDTNLLISCATSDITDSGDTTVNIAHLRSNFTSTGAYIPLQ